MKPSDPWLAVESMDMQPKDAFTAISTTEKVASSLYKWITGNRGLKRTVAIELQENIELIRLYVESGADPKELVPQLNDVAFRHDLGSQALARSNLRLVVSVAKPRAAVISATTATLPPR